MIVVACISLACALLPTILFCWNLLLYRAPFLNPALELPSISVLIPARDEELSITAAVESVLASTNVALELIVLDDASTDRTAELVRTVADRDSRLRLEFAPHLPPGWNGKQHACYVLSSLAQHEILCFLDADVRLGPLALASMSSFLIESGADLVSGFPRQETASTLEWLLLPLIHFILLGFLPLAFLRRSRSPAFAAGCGQFLMMRRESYRLSGTHAAIRDTMHDGILLPRLFRERDFRTDLADLTGLASCRMYRSAGEVWRGLAKNATEGIAAPSRILPFTLILSFGQVLPIGLVGLAAFTHNWRGVEIATVALLASLLPRLLGVARFRQRLRGAILHPIGVLLLLVLQWYALIRKLLGIQATWKQRAYDVS